MLIVSIQMRCAADVADVVYQMALVAANGRSIHTHTYTHRQLPTQISELVQHGESRLKRSKTTEEMGHRLFQGPPNTIDKQAGPIGLLCAHILVTAAPRGFSLAGN